MPKFKNVKLAYAVSLLVGAAGFIMERYAYHSSTASQTARL